MTIIQKFTTRVKSHLMFSKSESYPFIKIRRTPFDFMIAAKFMTITTKLLSKIFLNRNQTN